MKKILFTFFFSLSVSSIAFAARLNGGSSTGTGGGGGSPISVQNNDVIITTPTFAIDFSTSFVVTDSPTGEANVSISTNYGSGFIFNQNFLQDGATFYVSSGTASSFNGQTITLEDHGSDEYMSFKRTTPSNQAAIQYYYANGTKILGLGFFNGNLFGYSGKLSIFNDLGSPVASFNKVGDLQVKDLELGGGFGPNYPLLANQNVTLSTGNYFIRANPTTSSITIILPDIDTLTSPQRSKFELIICKIDFSTNIVGFKVGAAEDTGPGIELDRGGECAMLISSVTAGSDNGFWYPAIVSSTQSSTFTSNYVSSINATSPISVTGNGTVGSTVTIAITDVNGLTGLLANGQKVAVSTGGYLVGISSNINIINGASIVVDASSSSAGVSLTIRSTASASTGSSGGYAVEPATVPFILDQGARISSGTFTDVSSASQFAAFDAGRHLISRGIAGSDLVAGSTNYFPIGSIIGSSITLQKLGTPQYFTVQDFANSAISPGWISGGTITIAGATTVNVSSGNGWIKPLDVDVTTNYFMNWPSSSSIPISLNTTVFIGVKYNAGSPIISTKATDTFDLDTEWGLGGVTNDNGTLYISTVPWKAADNNANLIERFDSLAAISRDNRLGGLILSNTGTRNVAVTTGSLMARMNEFSVSAIDTSASSTFSNYYRNGSGGWTIQKSSTQWNNSQYDDGSGTLASLTALNYTSRWFYMMTDGTLAMLYGQAQYTTLASALNDGTPSTVPPRILNTGILIGRFIIQASGSTPAVTQSAFGTSFTAASVTNFSDIGGTLDISSQSNLTASIPLQLVGDNMTLTTNGVTSGQYTNANVTVSTYGLITAISSGTAGGGGFTAPYVSSANPNGSMTITNPDGRTVGSTLTFAVNPDSGTLQGNTFNGASQLLKLDASTGFNVSAGTITQHTSSTSTVYDLEFSSSYIYKQMWIPMRAGQCNTNLGCTPPAQYQTGISSVNYYAASFLPGATSYWNYNFVLPDNYIANSSFTYQVVWTSTASFSTASWHLDGFALKDGGSLGSVGGTYQTASVINSSAAVSNTLVTSAESGVFTLGSNAAGRNQAFLRLYRGDPACDGRALGISIWFPIKRLSSHQ